MSVRSLMRHPRQPAPIEALTMREHLIRSALLTVLVGLALLADSVLFLALLDWLWPIQG